MAFWKFFGSRQTNDGRFIKWPRRSFNYFGSTLVDEDSAMQVAAFNRGLIYISSQIAKLPWNIKDADNNIVKNSPIGKLLNLAANKEMNAFKFKLVMIQQAIIHGNSYAEIERDGTGRPVAMWPLHSGSMRLVRTGDGDLKYHYTANLYGGPSEPIILDPYDVFHVANFHTREGLLGQGIVSFGKEVLGINIAADNMAGGLFRNGGIPSGLLSHPGSLSDEAYTRLKDSWMEQSGGKKMGATAILEEGIVYSPMNVPPEALQFLQSRQFGVLEIARFLGLPPTKLFDVVAAKYANVENSNLEVATDTLDSWATNLELEADIKLLGGQYGGRYTDMDLYDIFRGDMTTRATYFKSMMSIGVLTPNQIRAREGLAGYKEGDNYYIATNNFTPVDRMNELIDADIAQKTKPAAAPASNDPAKKPNPAVEQAVITYLTAKK